MSNPRRGHRRPHGLRPTSPDRSGFARGARRALGGGLAIAVGLIVFATSPAGAAEHVVREGENLTAIARRYGVSATEIARLNQLSDPNHLLVGATLRVPDTAKGAGSSRSTRTPSGSSSSATRSRTSGVPAKERAPSFTIDDGQRQETARLLDRAAREFAVPPALLKALMYTESRWRQDVVSRTGAVGIGQLLPETASWLASSMGEPDLDVASLEDNVRMSARLLGYLLERAGSTKKAVAAYYQGIGAVLRDGLSPGGAQYAAVITSRQAWFA